MTQTPIIYAFPHAGADAGVYRQWIKAFTTESQFVFSPILTPGRGRLSQEMIIDDLPTLACRICEDIHTDIKKRSQGGPCTFATFGHSFGGVLSFVVSHMLAENYGLTANFSVISGSIAPSVQEEDDRHLWSDAKILEKMRADNGTPLAVLNEPAIARRLLTALRTDYILRQQFLRYRTTKVCHPLFLISADNDEHVTLASQPAWQNHTGASCNVTEISGGHFAVYHHVDAVRNLFLNALSAKTLVDIN